MADAKLTSLNGTPKAKPLGACKEGSAHGPGVHVGSVADSAFLNRLRFGSTSQSAELLATRQIQMMPLPIRLQLFDHRRLLSFRRHFTLYWHILHPHRRWELHWRRCPDTLWQLLRRCSYLFSWRCQDVHGYCHLLHSLCPRIFQCLFA